MSATATVIDSFTGEFRFLSNFFPAEVESEGISYPSVEHAYQAQKSSDRSERRAIATCGSPGKAKRLGRRIALRADWESAKVGTMTDLVRQKFSRHVDLRELLLATGEAELIEGNTWGDRFWGTCDGIGANHLGRILMQVRGELAAGV